MLDSKRYKMELERITRENTALQSLLTDKEKIIRERDSSLQQLTDLENSTENLRSKHKLEIQKMESAHSRELQKKQQQIDQLCSNVLNTTANRRAASQSSLTGIPSPSDTVRISFIHAFKRVVMSCSVHLPLMYHRTHREDWTD